MEMSHNLSPLKSSFLASFWVVILALLFASKLSGQTVTIDGTASSYSGRKIILFQTDDFISRHRSVLASHEIPADGSFRFTAVLEQPRELILAIGSMEAILHAMPNGNYSVRFPSPPSDEFRRFDKTNVDLELINPNPDDINILIRLFNRDYTRFISDHYYQFAIEQFKGSETYKVDQQQREGSSDIFRGSNNTIDTSLIVIETDKFNYLVEAFTTEVNAKYGIYFSNTYFYDHVRYSIAELELASGARRQQLYREYLMSQPAQPAHAAYIRFLELFYSGTITDQKGELRDELNKRINVEKNGDRIVELFSSDSLYLSTTVRTLAVVKGLSDAYYNPQFTQSNIEQSLQQLSVAQTNPMLASVALNTLTSLTKCRSDWKLEDFTLLDAENNRWTWSEHQGMYIYILFFADWCTSCKKDMQIMETLRKKYSQHIQFVAINMDENTDRFITYIQEHRDQEAVILYGGNDPVLRQLFNLKSIPHALFITPSGTIMSDYTRRPGEGIQTEFEKIFKKASEQGSGTWRDKK